MARAKKHTAEQIVNLLRQVEVGVANGKTLPQACKEAEIVEQRYYRWRKEYGGVKVDQTLRLTELERENAKLKRFVSEWSLEKLVLKDIAFGLSVRGGSGKCYEMLYWLPPREPLAMKIKGICSFPQFSPSPSPNAI